MSRFGRDYELVIGVASQAMILRPDLRLSFDAERSTKEALNTCTVRVYNLSQASRDRLVWDDNDTGTFYPLRLSVGYEGRLDTAFEGAIRRASSRREGADWVTTIEAADGGTDYARGFVAATVRGRQATIDAVLATWPNTQEGKIGAIMADILRPRVVVGQSSKVLRKALAKDQDWFIDGGKLHILRQNEVRQRFVPVVESATGLLGTPVREKKIVTFETIMNPALIPAGLCRLVSKTAERLSGVYRVDQINYTGDTHGGSWQQTVQATVAADYVVVQ